MYQRPLLILLAATLLAAPAWGQFKDGGGIGAQPLTSDGDDFDPPCAFGSTLPLDSSWNGNRGARAYYALGHGAVLDECSNFGVTGQSSPNFLAWNCSLLNADGTVPALPQLVAFTGGPVQDVSMSVGSASDAGEIAVLVALDGAFGVLDFDTVTLGAAMQTLSTSAAGTAFVYLAGPCVQVMDDLQFN